MRGSGEGLRFSALDVDLHQIHGGNIVPGDVIVQRNGLDADFADRIIRGRTLQAIHRRETGGDCKKIEHARARAYGIWLKTNSWKPVHSKVEFKVPTLAGRRLECDDALARGDLHGGEQGKDAVVRAHVKEGHPWLEKCPKESQFAVIVAPILEERPVRVIRHRKRGPPKFQRLARGNGKTDSRGDEGEFRECLP